MNKLAFATTTLLLIALLFFTGKTYYQASDRYISAGTVEVCPGNSYALDQNNWYKVEHAPFSYTTTEGFIIDQVCVKAGSSNQGDFPVYYTADTNDGCWNVINIGTLSSSATKIGVDSPDCKDISHASFRLAVSAPTPTSTLTITPTPTLAMPTPTTNPESTPTPTSNPTPTITPTPTSVLIPTPTSTVIPTPTTIPAEVPTPTPVIHSESDAPTPTPNPGSVSTSDPIEPTPVPAVLGNQELLTPTPNPTIQPTITPTPVEKVLGASELPETASGISSFTTILIFSSFTSVAGFVLLRLAKIFEE